MLREKIRLRLRLILLTEYNYANNKLFKIYIYCSKLEGHQKFRKLYFLEEGESYYILFY